MKKDKVLSWSKRDHTTHDSEYVVVGGVDSDLGWSA